MWDWITDQLEITFGEVFYNKLFVMIAVYIISLVILNLYINQYKNKILESEDEKQRSESTIKLHVVVSICFIVFSLILMLEFFSSMSELFGYY